jgi:hypothetical protein
MSCAESRHSESDSEARHTLSIMERAVALVGHEQRRPVPLPPALLRRAQVLFPAVAVHSGTHEVELAA